MNLIFFFKFYISLPMILILPSHPCSPKHWYHEFVHDSQPNAALNIGILSLPMILSLQLPIRPQTLLSWVYPWFSTFGHPIRPQTLISWVYQWFSAFSHLIRPQTLISWVWPSFSAFSHQYVPKHGVPVFTHCCSSQQPPMLAPKSLPMMLKPC